MLFNSISYLLFFPIVFILYWFVFDYALKRCKHQVLIQNIFLVLASYVFYAWWDWRFLGLLVGMSLISWLAGEYYAKNFIGGGITHSHKWVMWIAIAIDVATLGFFKYYNFFVESFCNLFSLNSHLSTLHLILPLGISFFTFQAISYVVDAYHGKINSSLATQVAHQSINSHASGASLIECFLYIGFFPKLLAGPIERPTHLIPQIQQKRVFDYDTAVDGCRQILWGLFKKVVVADNCATYVNAVYADYTNQSGSTLLLAAILYTIQIYGDFSGYSDMAIGSAKLLGFKFRDNFLFPYFSRNMNEFWRRWHISLNTWFVDYVYIPLGGSRAKNELSRLYTLNSTLYTKMMTIRNTLIIFLLSGLWHGADWSFVAWGGYHGLLLVLLILFNRNTKYEHVVAYDRWLPSFKELGQMLLVFTLATIGWMMFRADNMGMFAEYVRCMVDSNKILGPLWTMTGWKKTLFVSAIMFGTEWCLRKENHGLALDKLHPIIRYVIYYAVVLLILEFNTDNPSFIYFQF